jgi:hypothetical protein
MEKDVHTGQTALGCEQLVNPWPTQSNLMLTGRLKRFSD